MSIIKTMGPYDPPSCIINNHEENFKKYPFPFKWAEDYEFVGDLRYLEYNKTYACDSQIYFLHLWMFTQVLFEAKDTFLINNKKIKDYDSIFHKIDHRGFTYLFWREEICLISM